MNDNFPSAPHVLEMNHLLHQVGTCTEQHKDDHRLVTCLQDLSHRIVLSKVIQQELVHCHVIVHVDLVVELLEGGNLTTCVKLWRVLLLL